MNEFLDGFINLISGGGDEDVGLWGKVKPWKVCPLDCILLQSQVALALFLSAQVQSAEHS